MSIENSMYYELFEVEKDSSEEDSEEENEEEEKQE